MPKVTVILTSYNHDKYIRETIDSILNQTFKDFELIIWDDASTDNSWEIIQSYNDSRIKIFRSERTERGLINKALMSGEAQGEYIAIHHSDDVWDLTKLEKQVKFLDENSQYGAVFTNVQVINENSELFEDKNHPYYSIFDQPNRNRYEWLNFFFYKGNALCHPSLMIRKECYENCGLYRYGLAQLADFDMWIRICLEYEIFILSEKLTKFRVRDNEANSSGNSIGNNIRLKNDFSFVIKFFLNITNIKELKECFPNYVKYIKSNASSLVPEYIIAMSAVENKRNEIAQFGLSILYELINSDKKELLLKYHNFNYDDLIQLSSKLDIYSFKLVQEKDQQIQERDQQIQERDQQIQEKEVHIQNLNSEIIHLHNVAQSMRIKNRIKNIVKLFIPQKIWKIIKYVKNNPSSIKLGLYTLKTQGFKALINRISKVDNLSNDRILNSYTYNEPEYNNIIIKQLKEFNKKPLISIIMPVYNVDPKWLDLAIKSVEKQWYDNWELCIADDKSTNEETIKYLRSIKNQKVKVKLLDTNLNISGSSNAALDLASGEYIALMDNDDEITPDALYEVVKVINEIDADFIYSDEDKLEMDGTFSDPHFKPDFAPDMFLSQNYISHLGVIKKELIEKVDGFTIGLEGAQDYDLYLKVFEHANKIFHIQKVLYHWRKIPGSTAAEFSEKSYAQDAGIEALQNAMKRRKIATNVENGKYPGTYIIKYEILNNPLVSIIIPFKDMPDLLKMCIESILNKSTYRNFEIIGISNNSNESSTFDEMKRLEELDDRIKFYEYNVPFNYSDINNYAVNSYAKGEHIILLNNDIEIITSSWIENMLQHSQKEEVGCVGAKLYYPNDTIQHAGVIIGIGGVAGHSHKHFDKSNPGYFSRLELIQNVSAVTAACLMIKTKIFKELEGLNEENLKIAFNDVDFCLRVQEKGYRNIFTPYTEAYHHESISRGAEDNPEKIARFNKEVDYMKKRHKNILENGDPFYNTNLSLDREDFSLR